MKYRQVFRMHAVNALSSSFRQAWIMFKFRDTFTCKVECFLWGTFLSGPSCITFIAFCSKWKLSCESEFKIKLAQSHKLSWCLVGFSGHIVFTVHEDRGFTERANTVNIKWINTLRKLRKQHFTRRICLATYVADDWVQLSGNTTRPAGGLCYVSWYHADRIIACSFTCSAACKTFVRTRTHCIRSQNCNSHVEPCLFRQKLRLSQEIKFKW